MIPHAQPAYYIAPTPGPLPRRMVVNGVAIGSDYDKLSLYICTASTASPKPDACYNLPENMRHQG